MQRSPSISILIPRSCARPGRQRRRHPVPFLDAHDPRARGEGIAIAGNDGKPPLDGVRVLDASGPIGAYCTRLLADLGADVVLVEPPGGDPLRRRPPFLADDPAASLLFAYYHASKRSAAATLDDADRLADLGRDADVVVVSPSPRAPVAGWDPDARTLAWAPDAIVCAITPFGLTGPLASWRATAMTSYAMAGNMIRSGPPEGPPVTIPGRQIWDDAGAYAAVCVLAALAVVDEVGPQTIDLAVHEVETYKDFLLEQYDVMGMNPLGRRVPIGHPPTGTYQCADGPFDVASHQRSHWDAFLTMLGHPDELADPALEDPLVRRERYEELTATIAALVRGRSREDLVSRGQAAHLPCGMLHRPTEFVADRQLAARGTIGPCPTPWGDVTMPAPGAGFVSTPDLTAASTTAPAAPATDAAGWAARPARAAARATADGTRRGALDGVRVLSFGQSVAGNTTGSLLAQLGADVAKIEARARPEVLRTPAYAIGAVATEPSGVTNTVMEASLARSVRNLSLDVATPAGRDVFCRLVAVSDVVVENFGAGVLDGWDLSFDALRAINPNIVLTSLSGYGRTGPRSAYLAYATNVANFVGLTYEWNFQHGTHSDYVTAVHAVLGTLAALRHVRDGGGAVRIDSAQVEAMLATMPEVMIEALANGRDVPPPGNEVAGSLLSAVVACRGHDAWLAVEVEDLDDWARLGALLDVPVPASTAAEAAELRPALEAALHGWAGERTAATAARDLQHSGLAAGVVQSSEDVWHDPQLWARGVPVPFPQVDLGTWHYAESPLRLSRTPGRVDHVGGRLGADTAAILCEWLGTGAEELERLVAAGAALQA